MRDTRGVRAPGLQGDALPEIIEILDDDTDALRRPRPESHDPPTPAAPLGRAGRRPRPRRRDRLRVATSARRERRRRPLRHRPPRTCPQNDAAGPGTDDRRRHSAPPVPYYAADPPRQYKVQFAEHCKSRTVYYAGDNGFQLWATPGATATSRSWFSIDSFLGSVRPSDAQNAYRLHSDQGMFAIAHTSSGQTSCPVLRRWVELDAAHGVRMERRRSRAARRIRQPRQSGQPRSATPSSIAGIPECSARSSPGSSCRACRWNRSTTRRPPIRTMASASTSRPCNGESGGDPTLDRPTALQFLLDHATPFTVDGHSAVAGVVDRPTRLRPRHVDSRRPHRDRQRKAAGAQI